MNNVIYQHFDPLTLRNTEVEVDGKEMLFIHSQDTKPVVESCKAIASSFDPLVRRDTVHVARVPLVIWRQLQRLGITNDEKALNNWLNQRENRVFRTDDCSQL